LPLAWWVEATDGVMGFNTKKGLLEAVARWIPTGATVLLMGNRFYGTADLIGYCQDQAWDYRLRMKGNLTIRDRIGKTTTAVCAKDRAFNQELELTAKRARIHIAIIHDPAHSEPWIIAMSEPPDYLRTLKYSQR